MNIEELSKFLGLPAQNKEFDDYLSAHGISQRPTFRGEPMETIEMPQTGLGLIFETSRSHQRRHGPPHEDGAMIFSSLQAYGAVNDSDFAQYPGSLPYGLSFQSTLQEAIETFGEPTVNYPSGLNRSYVWHDHHGKTVSLCFLAGKRRVTFFALSNAAIKRPVQVNLD